MRFLCELKSDKELTAIESESIASAEKRKIRAEFLIAQLKKLKEQNAEELKDYWSKIEARLSALGHLNNYSNEKEFLQVDRETGQIFRLDNSEHHSSGIKKILEGLLS